MLRAAAKGGVGDAAQLVVNRNNPFVNDPPGGKSHMANAGIHGHVRDETWKEPEMGIADVAHRRPNKLRVRGNFNVTNDGCHSLKNYATKIAVCLTLPREKFTTMSRCASNHRRQMTVLN